MPKNFVCVPYATTAPFSSLNSHWLNPIVFPNRFDIASTVTVECIRALLTHETCKSVVTPPPFSLFSSSTSNAHVVNTSTIVAMHPPCNVPNRLHKDSWTYKSHLMPFSSRALLFSSFDDDDDFRVICVKFEQCKRGILSNVVFCGCVTMSKNFIARTKPSKVFFDIMSSVFFTRVFVRVFVLSPRLLLMVLSSSRTPSVCFRVVTLFPHKFTHTHAKEIHFLKEIEKTGFCRRQLLLTHTHIYIVRACVCVCV